MCIIVHNPKGKPLDYSELKIAYDNNPHGFGVMRAENNSVKVVRGILDFEHIKRILDDLVGTPHAFHLRWQTRGGLGYEQCHPHPVLNRVDHKRDLYMMHNGTFMKLPTEKRRSDTQIFANILRDRLRCAALPAYNLDRLNENETVESWNKLLFLSGTGKFTIVNESQGVWENGVWYSNIYSFIPDYRKQEAEKEEQKRLLVAERKRSIQEAARLNKRLVPGRYSDGKGNHILVTMSGNVIKVR